MFKKLCILCVFSVILSACTANQIGKTVGGIVGGYAGGKLGNDMGGDLGKAVGTAVGGISGAYAGGKIADSLSQKYYQVSTAKTIEALETNVDGDSTQWQQDTGEGLVTIIDTTEIDSRTCRDFTQQFKEGDKTETVKGMACQNKDGSWEITSRT